jgi:hypothetical protein
MRDRVSWSVSHFFGSEMEVAEKGEEDPDRHPRRGPS